MVAAGAGIGYVSRLSVQHELASGHLIEIHCAKLRMKRSLSVLIPQGPGSIGIVQAFSKFITTTTGTQDDSKSRTTSRHC
jgi:DNA-binding transcriptional LysR family regulator